MRLRTLTSAAAVAAVALSAATVIPAEAKKKKKSKKKAAASNDDGEAPPIPPPVISNPAGPGDGEAEYRDANPGAPEPTPTPGGVREKEVFDGQGRKLQEMRIQAPAVTEEDQYGYTMPKAYQCNGCKATLFQVQATLAAKQNSFADKKKKLKEYEVMDLLEKACDQENYANYGIKLISGQNVLSGTATSDEHDILLEGGASIQMGSDSWKKRIAEMCRVITQEKVGESEIYNRFMEKGLLGNTQFYKQKHALIAAQKEAGPSETARLASSSEQAKKEQAQKDADDMTNLEALAQLGITSVDTLEPPYPLCEEINYCSSEDLTGVKVEDKLSDTEKLAKRKAKEEKARRKAERAETRARKLQEKASKRKKMSVDAYLGGLEKLREAKRGTYTGSKSEDEWRATFKEIGLWIVGKDEGGAGSGSAEVAKDEL